jgi:RNA recognition motif-containing protein
MDIPRAAPHLQEQEQEEEAAISLYVSNIAFNVDEASLHDIFGKIGELQSVKMPLNPLTRESRGFAFVTFKSNADGERAVSELHEFEVGGRKLRVEQSRRKSGYAKSPGQYLGPAWASIKHNPDGAVRPGGGGPGGRGPDSGRGYRSNDSRPAPYSPQRYDDGRGRPAPRDEYLSRVQPHARGGGGGGDRERDFYRERDGRDYRRDGDRAPPPRDAGPPPRDRYYDERPDERRDYERRGDEFGHGGVPPDCRRDERYGERQERQAEPRRAEQRHADEQRYSERGGDGGGGGGGGRGGGGGGGPGNGHGGGWADGGGARRGEGPPLRLEERGLHGRE